MASNFYQILEANEAASQETLKTLYDQKSKRLMQALEDGSPTAKEQLWALRQAYELLSQPAQRAAYDDSLKSRAGAGTSPRPVVRKSQGLTWKINVLLFAILGSCLVGFGLYLGRANKKDDHVVQILQTNRSSDNDATRANTERALVDGVVSNTSMTIDRAAELGNRSLDIQRDAENRRRQEMEYRANADAEVLRQQQERLRIADEQLKLASKQTDEARRVQQDQDRMAIERINEINRKITRP